MSLFPDSQYTNIQDSTLTAVGRDQHIHMDNVNLSDPLAQLSPVPDAMYNSMRSVSRCMEGTREEVIGKIVKWMDGDGKRPLCWLHGPAGAGKSAISRTIAEICAKSDRLAASFFFLRAAGRRSSFTHFIRTLAYDLALSVPATRPHIEKVLKKDPHILHRSLGDQFRALVAEPIQSVADRPLSKVVRLVKRRPRPFVVVIDALDECDDKAMIAQFIEVIAQVLQDDRLPFQVLFTSRVEEHIRENFSAAPTLAMTYRLPLEDFDANADLRKFFRSRFLIIYEKKRHLMQNIELPWPSEADLAKLLESSAGSFIFAFTLVNFVDDGKDLPNRKLQACLQSHAGVDPLYIQILQAVPRNPRFLQIFETIMTVTEPLSVVDLACLFLMETSDVIHALLGVQSILIVPEDDNSSVRPFHTSLRDFLTTKERSENFYIDPSLRHFSIASDCLKAMTAASGKEFFKHGSLEFISRSWSHHFLRAIQGGGDNLFSQNDTSMLNTLMEFVSHSFDSWLDSIIYQGMINQTARNLDALISLLKGRQSPPSALELIEKITVFAKSDEKSFRGANNLVYIGDVYGVYDVGDDGDVRVRVGGYGRDYGYVRDGGDGRVYRVVGLLAHMIQEWRKSQPQTTRAWFGFNL